MINYLYAALFGLMCAGLITAAILLLLGLCRAAGMQSRAMPQDVREDNGEYDEA